MTDSEYRGEQDRTRERSMGSTRRSARFAPLGMLGLLAVQFLLGIAINLYVQIPSGTFGMVQMMRIGPLVMVHMMLGMMLAFGAMVTVGVALGHGRGVVSCAVAGLAGILVSGLGGLLFLMNGQSNGASYLMAVGFLFATGSYVAEIVVAR